MAKRLFFALLMAALVGPIARAQGPAATDGGAAQATFRLTLKDAIERGLQNNLRVLAAGTRIAEAEGTRERRLAGLLPRARVESVASLQNRSLQAFGISFPGVPEVVPPFSTYDFRVYAEQAVVDRQSYHAWKASEKQEQVARSDYQDLRDLLVRQIAALYLNAQAAAARVEATESRVQTAEALLRLATERRAAGVATGVDVLRAQVQLANEQQRRLEARTAAQQALLVLARNIGLSPGTPLELAEPLRFEPVASPEVVPVLAGSLATRADYLALASQREALVEQQKANRARYLPRFAVSGNYGGIGRAVGQVKGTGTLAAGIAVTVFDRDRAGEEQELASRLKRVDHQMADLRLGIEQEIREALLQMESATEEVSVAEQGRGLAARELELSRERFAAGVTSNIEIVAAQQSVARAQENYILALSRHSDAKMALARALGATEKIYGQYLGVR
jgi:outer membrane protein TolC